MQLSTAWRADLKGGNVLLKSTSIHDDPRGFICKARSPCLKGSDALGRAVPAAKWHCIFPLPPGTMYTVTTPVRRRGRRCRS